jgi:hypothetical protein
VRGRRSAARGVLRALCSGTRLGYRASATISRCCAWWERLVRSLRPLRSAWRRWLRCSRSLLRWWARWARRMIAQARLAGRRVRLSLFCSTTTAAPKVAYSSSRRTQAASSSAERSRAGSSRRFSARKAASSRCGPAGAAGRGGRPRPWCCQAFRNARSETPSSLRVWLMPTCAARRQASSAASRSS